MHPSVTVTRSATGTMTSCAVRSENSMAPESSPCSSRSTPSAWECSTMDCTSSAVNADATSSFGSTPVARTAWFASQLSATMTGRSTRPIHTSGGPNHMTAVSGPETARFFGTISPSTTCR
ncbi:Uncharacterised protein [Mycobacteroides abscessus]|nr:Uncharacterised protein [Mycobacteroides abscessus]